MSLPQGFYKNSEDWHSSAMEAFTICYNKSVIISSDEPGKQPQPGVKKDGAGGYLNSTAHQIVSIR